MSITYHDMCDNVILSIFMLLFIYIFFFFAIVTLKLLELSPNIPEVY